MVPPMRDGLMDSGDTEDLSTSSARQDSSWGPSILKQTSSNDWYAAFLCMSVTFAVNHAAVTTSIAHASVALQENNGNLANAVLYVASLLSSLFVAPPVEDLLGARNGVLIGMAGCSCYLFCFAMAASDCHQQEQIWGCIQGGTLQAFFAIGGSLLGGLSTGMLWTCQGAFFSAVVDRLSEAHQRELQVIGDEVGIRISNALTERLSSTFAMYLLGLECAANAVFTVLVRYVGLRAPVAFFAYAVCAVAVTIAFGCSKDLRRRDCLEASVCWKAAVAMRSWRDPKIWLLSFTNLTFGLSVAWLNGYVSPRLQTIALSGTGFVGLCAAVSAIIAAISSKVYARFAMYAGKIPIVLFGACCFLIVGALIKASSPSGDGPEAWGWGILAFYIFHGLGRGVYESTNKGIFSDFFQGPEAVGAFANCASQGTFSIACGFALTASRNTDSLFYLLLTCALLTSPCHCIAKGLQRREQFRNEFPLAKEDIRAVVA